MDNLINYLYPSKNINSEVSEFAEYGEEILQSEELTDKVYQTFVDMIVKGWMGPVGSSIKEFPRSDIALIYKIGPYIPCVKRIAYTTSIDPVVDGFPGIRVTSGLNGDGIQLIRPVDNIPHGGVIGTNIKKYKLLALWKEDNADTMDSMIFYFGIRRDGKIISSYRKDIEKPAIWHGASMVYPAVAANAWADSKYLWIAKTSEDIGVTELKLRLGLNKEHIKSLFYARKLPLTETGRKRPILHWVRAHQRRIKEGIDIDINPYLRGITTVEMDGLRFEITQPNKKELHEAEPITVRQAFSVYG